MTELSDRKVAQHLATIFNRCFDQQGVIMDGGAPEPAYVPGPRRATIFYREDFPASVLHEASHWCLASDAQRSLKDYGLRYDPPPRTPARRQAFFDAELPVQIVEGSLARAAGIEFRVSPDDTDAPVDAVRCFAQRVARARWTDYSSHDARYYRLALLLDRRWRLSLEMPFNPLVQTQTP